MLLAFVLPTNLKMNLSTVETCRNGLVGYDNNEATVCCDIHCEQCGGPGCGSPTISVVSANDFCASNILDNNELCSVTESASCVMDTAGDPVGELQQCKTFRSVSGTETALCCGVGV